MKAFARTTLLSVAVLATVLAIETSSTAVADVYKHVDENGNVSFSDKPQVGSEKVKIRGTTKRKADESQSRSSQESGDDGEEGGPIVTNYGSLLVLTPREGKVVDPASGTVQIILLPTPALGDEDELVINIDGKDVNQGREVNLSVKSLPNGPHTVYGRILNSKGETVIESTKVNFTIGE